MPFTGPTPADLDRIIDHLLPLVANDPNNPLAQPVGLTLAQIEQLSTRIGQRLTARLTGHALEQHAQATAPDVACPRCALRCRLTRKKRRLTTTAGPVEYREPASHCPDCRRDFFPGT